MLILQKLFIITTYKYCPVAQWITHLCKRPEEDIRSKIFLLQVTLHIRDRSEVLTCQENLLWDFPVWNLHLQLVKTKKSRFILCFQMKTVYLQMLTISKSKFCRGCKIWSHRWNRNDLYIILDTFDNMNDLYSVSAFEGLLKNGSNTNFSPVFFCNAF